jgi:hypothetical protein
VPGITRHVVRRSVYALTISSQNNNEITQQINKFLWVLSPPTTSCVTWTHFKWFGWRGTRKIHYKQAIAWWLLTSSQLLFEANEARKLWFKFSFSISISNCFNYHFAMRVRHFERATNEEWEGWKASEKLFSREKARGWIIKTWKSNQTRFAPHLKSS